MDCFLKIGRGLYARKDFSADFERQIMLACKRVPNGIVCLKSAVRFHGLLPLDPASIWMAIDFKAKKPVVRGLRFALRPILRSSPYTGSRRYKN